MAKLRRPDEPERTPETTPSGPILRELGPRRCYVDDAPLEADGRTAGWCPVGRGYAVAFRVDVIAVVATPDGRTRERKVTWTSRVPCPFACPACGRSLTWGGWCGICRSYPGDGWEDWRVDDGGGLIQQGHYARVAQGPQALASPAQVTRALTGLRRLAAGIRTVEPAPTERLPAWVTGMEP